MRILLVRHGQTDLNAQKRLQGSSEIPLNERGRQQARETHELVKKLGLIPTKLITSPLGRAIETGCIIAGIDISDYQENEITKDNKPSDVVIEPDLIEMSFGIYEQKNMEQENPEFLTECFDRPETYNPPKGGESYDEVVARANSVVEKLRSAIKTGQFKEEDIVMLVSHGALSHAIFETIKKTPRSQYWDVDFNNCAIAELFISEDGTKDNYQFISDGFEKNW